MNNDIIMETGDIEVYVETQTDGNGTERLREYSDAAGKVISSSCDKTVL